MVDLSTLAHASQVAAILTASPEALIEAYVATTGVGRPKKITPCARCGLELSGRAKRKHTRAKCFQILPPDPA
jgi:hypothetical protein